MLKMIIDSHHLNHHSIDGLEADNLKSRHWLKSSHQLGDLHLGRLDLLLRVDDRHRSLDVGDVLLHPLEGILLGVGPVGGFGSRVVAAAFLHPVPGVGVEEILFVRRTVFSVVKEWGEGVSVIEDENDDIIEAFNDENSACVNDTHTVSLA